MRGKYIGLALQGGGSYAAFTAGVLKALLNKRRNFLPPKSLHSISGTSGGALNAMLLGQALHSGEGTPTRHVHRLWQINRLESHLRARFQALQLVPDEVIAALVGVSRELMSANPQLASALMDNSHQKQVAMELIDAMVRDATDGLPQDLEEDLLPDRPPYVTVAATEVRRATAHYFTSNRTMIQKFRDFEIASHNDVIRPLSLRSVYASMAHPTAFNAVEIGEGIYWDGYYTCNPPFVYLFREGCDEVVLVRLVQQRREDVPTSSAGTRDRIEEIVQNSTINMEIQAYLAMRELVTSNRSFREGAELKLALRRFDASAIYHEIRLLKPGQLADEGYPLSRFVDKLLRMGRKAITDRQGFIAAYEQAAKGLQVVTEIDFETETVHSRVIDIDRLLFSEGAKETAIAEFTRPTPRVLRYLRRLRDLFR
ncbi:patatin-like phospholipase family protein [Aquisalimonas sp.]|uniref:patatin-like phospholipase family protein n=1 Tax=Aquisalimonas sp. TaxID=1872621 RepID=UPI0025C524BD|nr:patatin-like phospholipase family protein [Aquisalimonas sp.]